MLAQIGGWSELAQKYRTDNTFIGSWKGWQFGTFGGVKYKQCLWVAAAPEGLYIKTGPLFLFRLFHPPLLIPWSAINSIEEREFWWRRVFQIHVTDSPVKITLQQDALSEGQRFLGDKLKLLEKKRSG